MGHLGELGAHWPGGSFFFFGRLFHLDEVRDIKLKLKERIRRRIFEVKKVVDGVASIAQPITRTNLKPEVKKLFEVEPRPRALVRVREEEATRGSSKTCLG